MELIAYCKGEPYTVLYDECDHDLIIKHNWYIRIFPSGPYAVTTIKINGKQTYMHRLILSAYLSVEKNVVDHKNKNTIDNRRDNIRVCTPSENFKNRRPSGKSKYLGVSFMSYKRNGRNYGPYPVAQIRINGTPTRLGYFPSEEDAARAYDEMAKKHHGEFARLNFP